MFTRKQLEKLLKEKKIRGFTWPTDKDGKPVEGGKISKEKKWINVTLHDWGIKNGIIIINEYQFAKQQKRLFRFDWCTGVDMMKIAWEYEGLVSKKSRHTTISGYTNDTDKYNLAQQLGWRVFRYTALNYKKLGEDLKNIVRP